MGVLTFRKGTRYGWGEELSSLYNLLVNSSASSLSSWENSKNRRVYIYVNILSYFVSVSGGFFTIANINVTV